MTPFQQAVNQAMQKLAQDPKTIFVGQSVEYDGAAIYYSLDGVPASKRKEFTPCHTGDFDGVFLLVDADDVIFRPRGLLVLLAVLLNFDNIEYFLGFGGGLAYHMSDGEKIK